MQQAIDPVVSLPAKQTATTVSAYDAELAAASKTQQIPQSDLQSLVIPIRDAQLPPQQIAWSLHQSWQRLSALRHSQTTLFEMIGNVVVLQHMLEQAFNYLQPGSVPSFEQANTVFDQIIQQAANHACPPEFTARVYVNRGLIAAIKLNHQAAAHCYTQAVQTPGLIQPLQWQFQFERACVLEDLGRDLVNNAALEEAVTLYERELLQRAPREQNPAAWTITQFRLGNALCTLGQRQRGTHLLERAVSCFNNLLTVQSREHDSLDWAATQHVLGNALGNLAQRQADTEMLETAVKTFESALEVRSLEQTPEDWALTQNSYATVLLTLGQRKKDKTILKQSCDAYKNVLKVWTRARGPMKWAATMTNLGTALRVLGEHRKGPRTLEQSVAAYRSALSERTRERVPHDWAMTQNNLGAALHKLGVRTEEPHYLSAAIDAYQHASQVWTPERGVLTWAMTTANLAASSKALAELTGDLEHVSTAMEYFQSVAGVFREASHAQYYELVTEQIALLRKLENQINAEQKV